MSRRWQVALLAGGHDRYRGEVSEQPRCILTVHAHPDDEASKGAPTLAMYHAQGVYTVLVCCTGARLRPSHCTGASP